ncbi:MAG: hypothetical protein K0R39_4161 [Symbiobacteriaceae bacterium]|jgi:hypothetical protein|nr:hypothetical protein [Symbiobacteriaceae bacterium]
MMILGLLLLAVATGLPDLAALVRRGRRKEAAVVICALLIGFLAALSWVMHLPVPTIGATLQWLATPILGKQ